MLQKSVSQAINIRMATVYSGPSGEHGDESAWPYVISGQSSSRVGSSGAEK